MRVVVQRVSSASVEIIEADSRHVSGKIGRGLMVLLGISDEDTEEDLEYICDKVTGLRIFEDEEEKMNLALKDVGGSILLVSQFTLYGDCRKGKRPSFIKAARPEKAIPLYEKMIARMREQGYTVETGVFGAHMSVSIQNDGPVTLIIDSK
ncbi:MAG: D-aminoacyl-tRNA deacylase [Peptostreptococcaceae bacterium]|nr:D-aminoacyl-tRNA deacylase [Peptostreptococcaceae bacterium]